MKKSEELSELLQTLAERDQRTTVTALREAKAVVHTGRQQLTLSKDECELLFEDSETVTDFIEAIGSPEGANLELFDLEIDEEVKSVLESHFSTVDELEVES